MSESRVHVGQQNVGVAHTRCSEPRAPEPRASKWQGLHTCRLSQAPISSPYQVLCPSALARARRSYEHMGQARMSCVSGCTCEGTNIDAHDAKQPVSITVDKVMPVSQHSQCQIKVRCSARSQSMPTAGSSHSQAATPHDASSPKQYPCRGSPCSLRTCAVWHNSNEQPCSCAVLTHPFTHPWLCSSRC